LPQGSDPISNHTIIHANFASSSKSVAAKLNNCLDTHGSDCDMILIKGSLFKEQKFFLSKVFIGTLTSCMNGLKPNILFTTAGCASAGLDCSTVYNVIFHGFPPSVVELALALGHAGCHEGSGPDTG